VVALAVAGAAAWYLLVRGGGVLGGDDDHPVADFSFDLGKVSGTAVGEKAPEDTLQRAAQGVRRTLDTMYVAGFVDPSKWQKGTYPEVVEAFAPPAREQAAAEIASFSLGGEYARVEFVEPRKGRLSIRVLFDAEGLPTGAVATTVFGADGELTDGRPIDVTHTGTYYLHPDGSRWLIVGYEVGGGVGPAAAGGQVTPS
jgi:hypothetical protein